MSALDLENHLRNVIQTASPGDRLPTVRDLMRDFGLSQKNVQTVLSLLAREGRVTSHVGRGTFVSGTEGRRASVPARTRSVLMLTRSVGSARTRRVMSELQETLADAGVDSLQISYSSLQHGLSALRDLSAFDVCLVQSHFDLVSIELLSFVRRKTRGIIIDGATMTGIDVDAVASNWRESLEIAVEHLMDNGHWHVAFAGSALRSRPIEALNQHHASLRRWLSDRLNLLEPALFHALPTETGLESFEDWLRGQFDASGRLPFSALIVWGALDGQALKGTFDRLGIRVPEDLSVLLLGHIDVTTEVGDFFTAAGSSAATTVDYLKEVVLRRLKEPEAPFEVRYIPAGLATRRSVREINTI